MTIGISSTDIAPEAVIDGGANTCIIYHNHFHIIDTHEREVALKMTYGSSTKAFYFGIRFTMVDSEQEKELLKVNEAVIVNFQTVISADQFSTRSYKVNYVSSRYG